MVNHLDFGAVDRSAAAALTAVPDDVKVIFVSDMLASEYVGGAELSTQALIDSAPFAVHNMKSKYVTIDVLKKYQDRYWVFTNFSMLDINIIPSIPVNLNYSIIEYDYKLCKYRSPKQHEIAEQKPCDCVNTDWGKLIGMLYHEAKSIFFMSEGQQEYYFNQYPHLRERANSTVISSIFDKKFFETINLLNASECKKNNKYLILNSPNWIKGTDDAIEYAKKNNLEYELIGGLSYGKMLQKMKESKGIILMPKDWDTCPRMSIEAKMLGCDLIMNENVQHKNEEWFNTEDINDFTSYLFMATDRFWNQTNADINYKPTISGYTTTYNCNVGKYPWKAAINSMLDFCDEVIVVDGGSNDGTWKELNEWKKSEEKLKIYQNKVDWGTENSRSSDGQQKAIARMLCTMDFCWQMDSDEIIHEDDMQKVHNIIKHFPKNMSILSLPVIEYWGNLDNVRADIVPQKWRISRNNEEITHGIPKALRKFNDNHELYADWKMSDGCDYIDSNTLEPIPHASFYDSRAEYLRQTNIVEYEKYFNWAVNNYPSVFHYSWLDLERKIRSYRDFWSKQWAVTFNKSTDDSGENNVFFDKPWDEVTEEDIENRARELCAIGPRIVHDKVDTVDNSSFLIKCSRTQPKYVSEWLKK